MSSAPQPEIPLAELEGRLLYAVIVAGKSAKFADNATAKLWALCEPDESPFGLIRRLDASGGLGEALTATRVGNYSKIERCYREIVTADLDLRTCTPAELERIHGIGPKTARFFILWTRPEARYAALDVHILRWLRKLGVDAPRSTPSGPSYAQLEQTFLRLADERGVTPRELDYAIWCAGSGNEPGYQSPVGVDLLTVCQLSV